MAYEGQYIIRGSVKEGGFGLAGILIMCRYYDEDGEQIDLDRSPDWITNSNGNYEVVISSSISLSTTSNLRIHGVKVSINTNKHPEIANISPSLANTPILSVGVPDSNGDYIYVGPAFTVDVVQYKDYTVTGTLTLPPPVNKPLEGKQIIIREWPESRPEQTGFHQTSTLTLSDGTYELTAKNLDVSRNLKVYVTVNNGSTSTGMDIDDYYLAGTNVDTPIYITLQDGGNVVNLEGRPTDGNPFAHIQGTVKYESVANPNIITLSNIDILLNRSKGDGGDVEDFGNLLDATTSASSTDANPGTYHFYPIKGTDVVVQLLESSIPGYDILKPSSSRYAHFKNIQGAKTVDFVIVEGEPGGPTGSGTGPYSLTTSVLSGDGIVVQPEGCSGDSIGPSETLKICSQVYDLGKQVQIFATPNSSSGWQVDDWEATKSNGVVVNDIFNGGTKGKDGVSITMPSYDINVKVSFSHSLVSLVTIVDSGVNAHGCIQLLTPTGVSSDGLLTYNNNCTRDTINQMVEAQVIRIAAFADINYEISSWQVDGVTQDASDVIDVSLMTDSSSVSVKVFFTEATCNTNELVVVTQGGGTVSPSSGAYCDNTTKHLVPVPSYGYFFKEWVYDTTSSITQDGSVLVVPSRWHCSRCPYG